MSVKPLGGHEPHQPPCATANAVKRRIALRILVIGFDNPVSGFVRGYFEHPASDWRKVVF
jgi:hypothetical protein